MENKENDLAVKLLDKEQKAEEAEAEEAEAVDAPPPFFKGLRASIPAPIAARPLPSTTTR
jgi:hypothetical protein